MGCCHCCCLSPIPKVRLFMTKTLQSQLENPATPLESEIASLDPWFHNLHLPDGTQTAPNHPLGDFPTFKWKQLEEFIPKDLSGARVIDIGCNSGFYTFELARRGAQVTSIDVDPHYLTQARWAAERMGLEDRVSFSCMPLYELSRITEKFDIVWFMGVLYHLRYPLLALDIARQLTGRMFVLQCLTTNDSEAQNGEIRNLDFSDIHRMSKPGWPRMAFVEHDLQGDPTNWWLPNEACLQAMLRSSGFCIDEHPAPGTYICRPIGNSDSIHYLSELRAATGT